MSANSKSFKVPQINIIGAVGNIIISNSVNQVNSVVVGSNVVNSSVMSNSIVNGSVMNNSIVSGSVVSNNVVGNNVINSSVVNNNVVNDSVVSNNVVSGSIASNNVVCNNLNQNGNTDILDDTIYQLDIVSGKLIAEFKSVEEIVKLYPDKNPVSARSYIFTCLRGTRKTGYGCKWVYKRDITDLTAYFKENRPKNLFVDLFPELIKEWDFAGNVGIDINTITYGCSTVVSWLCLEKLGHPNYKMSLNSRTCRANIMVGCPTCSGSALARVHDPEEKKAEMNRVKGPNKTKIGDATELYITNLLLETGKYPKVTKIGEESGETDIVVTLESGIQKSIQVKTMYMCTDSDTHYRCHIGLKYPDKMLIAITNQARTYFALDYSGNIRRKKIHLYFNDDTRSIYKSITYLDEKKFLEKLIEMIPDSVNYKDYEDYIESESIKKEHLSLKRFKKWCECNGFTYDRHKTNGDSIDIFVDGVCMQAKFRTLKPGKLSSAVSLAKSGGYLNGKKIKKPYCEDEDKFKFLIVEFSDELSEHENHFCIIPRQILLDNHIFETKTMEGKMSITVHAHDSDNNDNEYKKYWLPPILSLSQKTKLKEELQAIKNKP